MNAEADIAALLDDRELAASPLGKVCAELLAERARLASRLERISRISDGYQADLRNTNRDLVATNQRLEAALLDVRTLRGFIPVCSKCKKVRDDSGYWDSVENYLGKHSDLVLGSSVCPHCIAERADNSAALAPAAGDDADVEQRHLATILANADWRDHPLRTEYERLSASFQKLARRLTKISRISDGFQTQLKELNASLAAVSRTDPLTGVANRRAMIDWLDDAAADAESGSGTFAVAMVDIDHFKRINDTFGHAVGDNVLRTIASVLVANKGDMDFAARWGGEEFLLLLRAGGDDVAAICERVRAEIEAVKVNHNGKQIRCTVSIGVAQHEPMLSAADTIRDADRALYAAKSFGRNTVVAAETL